MLPKVRLHLGATVVSTACLKAQCVNPHPAANEQFGDRAFKVQTVLTEPELRLTDTNEALTGRPE